MKLVKNVANLTMISTLDEPRHLENWVLIPASLGFFWKSFLINEAFDLNPHTIKKNENFSSARMLIFSCIHVVFCVFPSPATFGT